MSLSRQPKVGFKQAELREILKDPELQHLREMPNIWSLGPMRIIRNFANRTSQKEGAAVVAILEKFSAEDDEARGFGAAYNWINSKLPYKFESIGDAREVFSQRRNSRQYNIATAYISDALVALAGWLEVSKQRRDKRLRATSDPQAGMDLDRRAS